MDKITTDILDTVEVGALATVNRDRTPLITPLHFVRYKNDNIIWISDRQSRHAVNAYRSGVVEFVVWNDQKSAVFLTTKVRELPEEEEVAALEAYANKLGDFMPRVENRQIYIMPIGQLDEKNTTGNWRHYIA